jgi:hypothetical protein
VKASSAALAAIPIFRESEDEAFQFKALNLKLGFYSPYLKKKVLAMVSFGSQARVPYN